MPSAYTTNVNLLANPHPILHQAIQTQDSAPSLNTVTDSQTLNLPRPFPSRNKRSEPHTPAINESYLVRSRTGQFKIGSSRDKAPHGISQENERTGDLPRPPARPRTQPNHETTKTGRGGGGGGSGGEEHYRPRRTTTMTSWRSASWWPALSPSRRASLSLGYLLVAELSSLVSSSLLSRFRVRVCGRNEPILTTIRPG